MGKEWLYWGGSGGASSSGKKRRSRGGRETEAEATAAAPGCMCAVFHFLDLYHLPFTLPQQARPSLSPDTSGTLFQDAPIARIGVEAPRNSLELNEYILEAASSSSTMKYDENLNAPVGIRIKTSGGAKSPRASTSDCRAKTQDISSSECSSSPATKTPNLVARLMGLELLPEGGSHSFSPSRRSASTSLTNSHMHVQGRNPSRQFLHSRSHGNNGSLFYNHEVSGTVSLPETPRISSARKSDVDRHRLSLQISKENVEARLDVSMFGVKKIGGKRGMNSEEENMSATDYARRIVKQMKERVSRKFGVDITNTTRSGDDHIVVQPSYSLRKVREDCSFSAPSTPSCSPRLSFLENKKKLQPTGTKIISKNQDLQTPRVSSHVSLTIPQVQQQQSLASSNTEPQVPELPEQLSNHIKPTQMPICSRKPKQASDAIRSKKEEPFIRSMGTNRSNVSDKKSKKTPLTNELLNISVPTLLPLRKDASLSDAQFRDKQSAQESDAPLLRRSTQLFSCSSHSYPQKVLPTQLSFQEKIQAINCTSNNNSPEESEHYRYIQRILKRIGVDKATPLASTKWYSLSHPLDPSIFHYLELFHPTTIPSVSKLNCRCQRKLIFHLVDELIVDIIKRFVNLNPWNITKRDQMFGSELIDILCKKIADFPAAKCQVLEDIDAMIDVDLRRSQLGKLHAIEEEGESIIVNIERDIVEQLMHETAMVVLDMGRAYNVRDGDNKI